jgi:hypothetical protein
MAEGGKGAAAAETGAWSSRSRFAVKAGFVGVVRAHLVEHKKSQGRRQIGVAGTVFVDFGDERGQGAITPRRDFLELVVKSLFDRIAGAVAANRDGSFSDPGHG